MNILVEIRNYEYDDKGDKEIFDSVWEISRSHKRELKKILRKWYNERA